MGKPVWVGAKGYVLYHEPLPVVCLIFSEYSYNTIKGKKRVWTKKINNGEVEMPPRPRNYEASMTPAEKRKCVDEEIARTAGAVATSQVIDNQTRQALHQKLDEALDQLGTNPELVTKMNIKKWDMGSTDAESNPQVTPLTGISLDVDVKTFEPKWDIVRHIDCDPLPYNKVEKISGSQKTFIVPDPQIGYRRYEDGTLDPFHDEKAIDIALQAIGETQPDRVVLVGDLLDLPNFSRYEQTPEFAQTTNASLEYAHRFLKTIREMLPEAEIVYLAGNHEARLLASIRKNLMEAYGIRRAGEELPLFSIPSLLALDKLNVEYVEGYPAGRYYINPTLMIMHGVASQKTRAAKSNTTNEGTSSISGHTHRIEAYARTVRTHDGARQTFAFSSGCLCRIDGAVPSMHGSQDLYGRPLTNFEDWQQGFGIVLHDNKRFSYQQYHIDTLNGYKTDFNGRVLTPRRKR